MLLILRSAALKLRSASTLLRVDAVSNGHNKEGTEKSLWHATATVEEEEKKKGTQVYLLSRPWSLCGLVLCVCIWMPSRSLSLDVGSPGLDGSVAEGPYEQTKLTEQGR